ncbi:MAG TPA: APC family permease [Pseudonocardiaceae bacterium]|nr:APC family permease [Pseudonocardiaceae bacterium]
MNQQKTAIDGPVLHRSLSTSKIVFLVVAAAAPLAAMVGTVPLAFAIGNGAGVPATFAFASLTLLCFSVGYAAMSRRIVNTGGFYTYVARGLGRPTGVAAGLVGVIAYNTLTIGMVGAFGYFAQLVASSHGLRLPWEVWSALAIVVVGVLGYRQINVSARIMAVLTVAEVAILALLVIGIVGHLHGGALPAASFDPSKVLVPGLGVALMFAFMSFTGFESAANYGEEAPRPERSVPVATYAAVLLIGFFYTLTSWAAVGGVGATRLRDVAGQQLGDLFPNLSSTYVGSPATIAMQVLICTSLFGATLAMHNAANRYGYVLGRERVLPSWLGAVHRTHGSPYRASAVQTTLTILVVAAFAVGGLDPYTNLATTMLGLGTLAIVLLQAAAAASVIAFFRTRSDRHWWRTIVAPLLGCAGLLTTVVLLLVNFSLVTGTTAVVVNLLPLLLLLATVGGIAYGLWLRSARRQRYALLATVPVRDEPRPVARSVPSAAR